MTGIPTKSQIHFGLQIIENEIQTENMNRLYPVIEKIQKLAKILFENAVAEARKVTDKDFHLFKVSFFIFSVFMNHFMYSKL